ncbi:MAG TPA: SURF1 family protein, partial [Allosphingosinicella sp.]|nr:SURF1 family protein [Allosphingosinicella sp.]
PTIIVLAAAATMVALGIWQLQRAGWKERLLAQYAEAATMPPVDLDPLLERGAPLPNLGFRRALITCRAIDQVPDIHVGRNAADEVGQVYLVPCRPGASGAAGRVLVNAGWSPRPDALPRLTIDGIVAGRLGAMDEDRPVTLTAARAVPPLVPTQPASMANIPNNHLAYAFQWFAFAVTALIIYFVALRRRGAPKLPPEP